jgi:integrase
MIIDGKTDAEDYFSCQLLLELAFRHTQAWRKALSRAGIKDFKWHDLRHTWASWHVQNGTSLQELQQLGGWATFEMVLRYAHLSSAHLKDAAERIYVTKTLQPTVLQVTI